MKVEDYIQETPIKMREIIEKSAALFENIKQADFDKIILTGSGTSFHAALQTKPFLQKLLKIEIEALYPFQVTNETFLANQHQTLVIGLSQGGSSYSTYHAMVTGKHQGARVASMAGAEHVLIDEVADDQLTVFCGEENAGPKTKGYTTTKLNLMLFGLFVALERKHISESDFKHELSLIESAIGKFQQIYQISNQWVSAHKQDLAKVKDIRVIGMANQYGDVLETALKILETLRIPVTGYEFEEFIHGIYNAINEESTLIIYDFGQEERVKKLIDVLSEWTNHVYVVTNQKDDDQRNSVYLPIDAHNPYEMLFLLIPMQLICACVPELKGVDPSIPKDKQFHQKLNSKRL